MFISFSPPFPTSSNRRLRTFAIVTERERERERESGRLVRTTFEGRSFLARDKAKTLLAGRRRTSPTSKIKMLAWMGGVNKRIMKKRRNKGARTKQSAKNQVREVNDKELRSKKAATCTDDLPRVDLTKKLCGHYDHNAISSLKSLDCTFLLGLISTEQDCKPSTSGEVSQS